VDTTRVRTCLSRDRAPAAVAVRGDVLDELLVFLRRPQAPPDLLLVAAGVVPHLSPPSLYLSPPPTTGLLPSTQGMKWRAE
jgi:hypothetical protein